MHHDAERKLLACSLWLRIGFIGASALAAGLIALFSDEAGWLSALALVFLGGVLAAASWGHARALLGDAEQASASAGAAPREPARHAAARASGRGRIVMPSAYSAASEQDPQ